MPDSTLANGIILYDATATFDSSYQDSIETDSVNDSSGNAFLTYGALTVFNDNFSLLDQNWSDTDSAIDSVNSALITHIDSAFYTHSQIDTFLSFFNGTFAESFNALVESDGVNVTMTLEKSGGGDLTMQFSDGLTTLDCTPKDSIALSVGTDAAPQSNYIYIPKSTKVLTKSTTGFPTSEEHIKVSYFFVPSATFIVDHGGTFVNQNWNDHLTGTDNQGHLTHMAERSRRLGAIYKSGMAGAGTSTNVGNYLTISAGTIYLKMASGVVYQMHTHTIPAVDSQTDIVLVKNWNGDPYHHINNLYDIVADSEGNTILNNKYFNLVVWRVANKTGTYEPTIINLPSGTYSSQADAEADINAYDDYTIPKEFSIESSTGVLVARLTLQKTPTTWTAVSYKDLRGNTPATAASGSGGTGATTLVGLSDTNIVSPQDGYALLFDSASQLWIADSVTGGGASVAYVDAGDSATLALADSGIDSVNTALETHIADSANPHNVNYTDVGAAAASHTHAASDVTSGTFDSARIPTLAVGDIPSLPTSKITSGVFDSARIPTLSESDIGDLGTYATVVYSDAGDDSVISLLSGYSLVGHTHAASDVTSGTFDSARIPFLDASDVPSGIFDSAQIPTLAVGDIPSLPASQITSGVFDSARIPTLSESDIGDLQAYALITYVDSADDSINAVIAGLTYIDVGAAAASHTHAASDITSGEFDSARIPTLSESDIGDLGSYSVVGHTHTTSDITDISTYATVSYVDLADSGLQVNIDSVNSQLANYLPLAGGTMAGDIVMGNFNVEDLNKISFVGSVDTYQSVTMGASGGDGQYRINWVLNSSALGGSTVTANITTENAFNTGSHTYEFPNADGVFVLDTASQTLTNKTISFSTNTFTGTIDSASLPDLDASDVPNGIFDSAQIPTLAVGDIPSLPASQITSGEFDSTLIPTLAPSDISGTLWTWNGGGTIPFTPGYTVVVSGSGITIEASDVVPGLAGTLSFTNDFKGTPTTSFKNAGGSGVGSLDQSQTGSFVNSYIEDTSDSVILNSSFGGENAYGGMIVAGLRGTNLHVEGSGNGYMILAGANTVDSSLNYIAQGDNCVQIGPGENYDSVSLQVGAAGTGIHIHGTVPDSVSTGDVWVENNEVKTQSSNREYSYEQAEAFTWFMV